ncbi:hypothetical protein CU098_004137 [Rhizopus stolonifer]|uniref:Coth-domain-containing protein n=1 Tax=Rhizopus stolonifer TaxID=4846 RepID=A0A367ITW1_RHIST|nr:hypothetical protein CU098_004137 [Rhizopus stolonifer]
MSLLKYILATVLLVSVYAIEYRVIVPEQPSKVSVLIDGTHFSLEADHIFPILYKGNGPIAQSGYQYHTNQTESFMRRPVQKNTPNEFFDRSWNTQIPLPLPQIYAPLPAIDRISSALHKSNEIPTIHLLADPAQINALHRNISADLAIQTQLHYLSNHDLQQRPEVELSLSGRTSRNLPKLAYNLKLKTDLYGYRRLKLRSLSTDPSYIREQVSYNFIRSVGLISSEFSYVRLVINQQPMGLFGLVDTFKGNWLSNVFANGRADYERGILYEGVRHTSASEALGLRSDLSFMSNLTSYGAGQYKIKVKGVEKKGYRPLQKLTRFIANAPNDTKIWNKHLDTESFLRSMALEVLLGYGDGYLTMCDNFYLYQHPDTKQFIYIPSDLDLTLGNTFFKQSDMTSGNYSRIPAIHTRPLFINMMRIPEFKQRFEWLIQDINLKLMDPALIFSHYKRIADLITEDVAWDQKLPRVGGTYYSEIAGAIQTHNTQITSQAHVPDNADVPSLIDMGLRLDGSIPFKQAIDGPTGHISLPSIKDWFFTVYHNINNFFRDLQN